ncbi:MAG: trypsin-like serine protease, partial [Actinomycetota bacterium]|nr:trypsin-like serine protease [Actinomycetota bacterium]
MAALNLTGRGGRLGVAAALCAASLAAAGPSSASPGDATPQPRIIGGGAADPAAFPFAAAILAKGRFVCSGSIVGPRHIVTAAHCSVPK